MICSRKYTWRTYIARVHQYLVLTRLIGLAICVLIWAVQPELLILLTWVCSRPCCAYIEQFSLNCFGEALCGCWIDTCKLMAINIGRQWSNIWRSMQFGTIHHRPLVSVSCSIFSAPKPIARKSFATILFWHKHAKSIPCGWHLRQNCMAIGTSNRKPR